MLPIEHKKIEAAAKLRLMRFQLFLDNEVKYILHRIKILFMQLQSRLKLYVSHYDYYVE